MAFCPSCGSSVDGRFCPKCGTAVGEAAAAPPPPGAQAPPQYATPQPQPQYAPPPGAVASAPGMTENMASALCYALGLVTGIIFLVLAPYNQNRNIKFHAFQSIFMHLALIVCYVALTIVSIMLHGIPVVGALMSILISLALGLGSFVLWLFMLFKTYNGEKVVLPVVGELAQKQANT
jgi:uncharacterized membrane protein